MMEPAPASPAVKLASKWLRLLAHGMDLALSLALVRAIGVLVGYQPEAGSLSKAAIFLIPPAVIAALAVPAIYLGGTLGQRICGLSLVDVRTLGTPRAAQGLAMGGDQADSPDVGPQGRPARLVAFLPHYPDG